MGDETRADLGQVADIGIVARPGMSSDDILELRESFEMFDPDAKGTISVQELRSSMESLGYGKSHVMYKLLEEAGDSRMNFDQFLDIVTARISGRDSKEDLERVFRLFDAEGKGFITAENLAKIASDLGEQIGESEIKEMINRADTDGDGHVNQTEFVQMLSKKPSV